MKKFIKQSFVMVLAGLLYAVVTNVFIKPGQLLPGGMEGLGLLSQKILSDYFYINIPYSLFIIVLNIIPLYIGFKYIGKKFTFLSLIMIASYSLFVALIPIIPPFTNETLLFLLSSYCCPAVCLLSAG